MGSVSRDEFPKSHGGAEHLVGEILANHERISRPGVTSEVKARLDYIFASKTNLASLAAPPIPLPVPYAWLVIGSMGLSQKFAKVLSREGDTFRAREVVRVDLEPVRLPIST